MRASYWDTSCVLALYAPEEFSRRVTELVSVEYGPLHTSEILGIEMIFALHAKESRREISAGGAAKASSKFDADVASGRFLLTPAGSDIKLRCRSVAAAVRRTVAPLRTLDGIHIATALELGSSQMITADKRMAAAAATVGLGVLLITGKD